MSFPDWQQICPDSSPLPLRRRQQGVAARQLLLHHARPSQQEEDHGAKQVAVHVLLDQALQYLHIRRQIRVTKVLIHENFTDSMNDVALLQLGKKDLSAYPFHKQLTDERVDLSVFRPACLPEVGESFLDQNGHVYGELIFDRLSFPLYLRLGRHWSPRDLHRQTAGDCCSHHSNEQLYGKNGTD